jgi:hypothetical protein
MKNVLGRTRPSADAMEFTSDVGRVVPDQGRLYTSHVDFPRISACA